MKFLESVENFSWMFGGSVIDLSSVKDILCKSCGSVKKVLKK